MARKIAKMVPAMPTPKVSARYPPMGGPTNKHAAVVKTLSMADWVVASVSEKPASCALERTGEGRGVRGGVRGGLKGGGRGG